MKIKPRKVLILGSGGLKIGQAGEFDYSGSQAIKALKEEKIKTVLINPNIATIQTSKGLADRVYLLPVTPDFVERIIEKEKPDSILLSFGGQTALNCGVDLYNSGVLKKYNVEVLGTSVQAIQNTEDRELFVKCLDEIGIKTPTSIATKTTEEAKVAAKKIGFPVMIRAAYALGGKGSGICSNEKQLITKCKEAFSSTKQVLVEEWLGGWKEIEYEVVRDIYDNCVTVCNMENFDPLGIHTGESIVVAPSQTLNNSEYHKLREIAIKVIRHLGIVGECNIQYALDPNSEEYRVIEVNARLSRSSALASKATGYPLAHVAAKLALGYSLTEIKNKITKKTSACFEPALDYVVVKIPRWDLKKFKEVDKHISSEMKSVGEVMGIGRTFEEALQKALRMVEIGAEGLTAYQIKFKNLQEELECPTDQRIFAIAEGMSQGLEVEKIHSYTKIDKWFLYKLQNIVDCEKELHKNKLNELLLRKAKQLGFSDKHIAEIYKKSESSIRQKRKSLNIVPHIKQIDTLGAEYPAKTNYLYFTYNGTSDDIKPTKGGVIVLGSGAYRIGSSVEFDWCCVNAIQTAKRSGFETIMINFNPETVSTDYDECDKLYFEEISLERVLDIYEFENPKGVIVSMGGQTPNNLAIDLYKNKVNILGTSPKDIDRAENRHKFSKLLDSLGIDQPEWEELATIEAAKKFANLVEYPVLIRPSYVLSGAAMNVVWDDDNLVKFLKEATELNPAHPVVMTKFIKNSKEVEVDAVAQKGEILIYAITEHIENAGVHSGDATVVLPAQQLYIETIRRVKKRVRQIAKELNITGPFNIQFLAHKNKIQVIECNLRASRSFPFCSKVFKQNMIEIATKAILKQKVERVDKSSLDLDYVGVKVPQFSFSRLKGADPISGVEMASTGEVGCLGHELNNAFLKAMLSAGFTIPKKNIFFSADLIEDRVDFLDSFKKLEKLGFTLFSSTDTSSFLKETGINAKELYMPLEKKKPNVIDFIKNNKIDLVLNIPQNNSGNESREDSLIRRTAVDFGIPLITNIQIAKRMTDALEYYQENGLDILSWEEY